MFVEDSMDGVSIDDFRDQCRRQMVGLLDQWLLWTNTWRYIRLLPWNGWSKVCAVRCNFVRFLFYARSKILCTSYTVKRWMLFVSRKKIFLSGVGLCSKWVAKKSAPLNPFTPKIDQRGISPRYCFWDYYYYYLLGTFVTRILALVHSRKNTC